MWHSTSRHQMDYLVLTGLGLGVLGCCGGLQGQFDQVGEGADRAAAPVATACSAGIAITRERGAKGGVRGLRMGLLSRMAAMSISISVRRGR